MKKIVLLAALIALPSFVFAAVPARTVVFGDSLSDTGNFPEPSNVDSPKLELSSLYVPLSNPVSLADYGQPIVRENLYATDTWSYPTEPFLNESIESPTHSNPQGKINGVTRKLYSMNWPLFYVYNTQKEAGKLKPLWTWYNYVTRSVKLDPQEPLFINYAWSSALSDSLCRRSDYTIKPCDPTSSVPTIASEEKSIIAARQFYIINNIPEPSGIDGPTVPDMLKQVDFYMHDFPHVADGETHYLLYIGGNDISDALQNKLLKFKLIDFFAAIGSKNHPGTIASHVFDAVSRIEAYQNGHPYQIDIMLYPSIADTPEAYYFMKNPLMRKILRAVIQDCVQAYNSSLMHQYGKGQHPYVHLVDLHSVMQTLSQMPQYKQHEYDGTTCFGSSPAYSNPALTANHACSSYFWWNTAHFSSDVNSVFAKFIADKERSQPKMAVDYPKNIDADLKLFLARA